MKVSITSHIYRDAEELWDYVKRIYREATLSYKSPSGVIFVECSDQTYREMARDPNIQTTITSKIKLTQASPLQEAPVVPAAPEIWVNTVAKRVGAAIAWDAGFRGEGVTVAVLDSGINPHKTLKGKIAYEEALITNTTLDQYGHGTSVASVIVGEDPSTGFTGIAPKASIINIKMMNDQGESDEELAVKAVDRAVELKADIINISWGLTDTGNPNEAIRIAVRNAAKNNIIITCAAGNGGPSPMTITSPATDPATVAVGSCTASEIVSTFSSRGPTKEGLTKPEGLGFGENLIVADPKTPDGLAKAVGTSFSAPQGSGIAALGRQIFGATMNRDFIEKGLKYSSTKPPSAPAPKEVKDNDYGYGTPDFRILGAVATIPGVTPAAAINPSNILNLILLAIFARVIA